MVIAKIPALDKTIALSTINEFLEKFQDVIVSNQAPNLSDFEKILSPNFKLFINGRLDTKDLSHYLKQIMLYQKGFKSIDLSDLLEEPIVDGNKVVIQYDANLNGRNGQQSLVSIIAIVLFEDKKISQWIQVAHEKGESQWDM
jgi:hypothetical protein